MPSQTDSGTQTTTVNETDASTPPPQRQRIEQILSSYAPMSPVPRPHVFVGMPAYGGQLFCGCAQSLMDCLLQKDKHGVEITIRFLPGESLITRGRNSLVAEFLTNQDKFTHMFFIDADISFSPESFFRLVKCNHPISACIYPKKALKPEKVIAAVKKNPEIDPKKLVPTCLDYVVNVHSTSLSVPQDRFVPVSYVGTGFMCIRREAILRMVQVNPQTYVNDIESLNQFSPNFYLLFDCMVCPTSNRYLSEDYAFCQKALNSGIPIFADLLCPLTHTGTYSFNGWWLSSLKVTRSSEESVPDAEAVPEAPATPTTEVVASPTTEETEDEKSPPSKEQCLVVDPVPDDDETDDDDVNGTI